MATHTRIVEADSAGVARAVAVLRAGGLVGLPTETVYGLAADAANGKAVARIFDVKGRPSFNPLISHMRGAGEAARLAEINRIAEDLMTRFWPGPLTLVLPKKADAPVHDLVTAGLTTIAVRAPAHMVAQAVLAAFGGPLAAPSANPSGKLSPTRAEHVAEALGDEVDLILDGGACEVGLESTVVEVAGDEIYLLRPGAVTLEELRDATGVEPQPASGEIKSPGQLTSHYAPDAAMRLDATERRANELLLGFGEVGGDLNLSESGDLVEAAANFFAMLRTLDRRRPDRIAVAPIPEHGLGRAINDRLRRAAGAGKA